MSTVTQDINELTTVDEIVAGDKIIIDNGEQTRLVDFSDFIIGLDNVTFKETIETNSSNITSLSTTIDEISAYVQNVSPSIPSTSPQAVCYMIANSSATTVSVQNQFYKIGGATTAGDVVNGFTHTSGRLTYTGTLSGIFKVTADLSITSGNNNTISIRTAKNGVTRISSTMQCSTNSSGSIGSISIHDLLVLVPNDYIEVYVANTSHVTNITVTYFNLLVV